MVMKVTILGCGATSGVPTIGGHWGACDPANPRNRRLRSSILMEEGETRLLVDTSPDLRAQLLAAEVGEISAVVYTHAHADHAHGINDLRTLALNMKRSMPIWADAMTIEDLRLRFGYLFTAIYKLDGSRAPIVEPHEILPPHAFEIDGIRLIPYVQDHGPGQTSLGFRVGDFAYSTDVARMDDASFAALAGLDTWVVDCIGERAEVINHSWLEQTLGWIDRLRPRRAYLTHMHIHMDYADLMRRLPAGVEPAYDGLVIEMDDAR